MHQKDYFKKTPIQMGLESHSAPDGMALEGAGADLAKDLAKVVLFTIVGAGIGWVIGNVLGRLFGGSTEVRLSRITAQTSGSWWRTAKVPRKEIQQVIKEGNLQVDSLTHHILTDNSQAASWFYSNTLGESNIGPTEFLSISEQLANVIKEQDPHRYIAGMNAVLGDITRIIEKSGSIWLWQICNDLNVPGGYHGIKKGDSIEAVESKTRALATGRDRLTEWLSATHDHNSFGGIGDIEVSRLTNQIKELEKFNNKENADARRKADQIGRDRTDSDEARAAVAWAKETEERRGIYLTAHAYLAHAGEILKFQSAVGAALSKSSEKVTAILKKCASYKEDDK